MKNTKISCYFQCLVILGAAGLSSFVQADTFDDTLDIEVSGMATRLNTQGFPLKVAPAATGPSLLEGDSVRLNGTGDFWGGVYRTGATLGGWRFGAGVGFGGVHGLSYVARPLPDNWSLKVGNIWAGMMELYGGYAWGKYKNVRPYLEIRGGLTFLQSQIGLIHPVYGELGASPHNAYLGVLSGRVGLLVPLSEYFFLDMAVGYGIVGQEKQSFVIGLGLPIPMSHL
jgi:hypothetical protein